MCDQEASRSLDLVFNDPLAILLRGQISNVRYVPVLIPYFLSQHPRGFSYSLPSTYASWVKALDRPELFVTHTSSFFMPSPSCSFRIEYSIYMLILWSIKITMSYQVVRGAACVVFHRLESGHARPKTHYRRKILCTNNYLEAVASHVSLVTRWTGTV
jgi:hypothetical protein